MPGVRHGDRGDLLIFCQCCDAQPQILATVKQGKMTIEKRHHGLYHYVILGPELVDLLLENRRIPCLCCEGDEAHILAECRDELLLIRAIRHQKPHFLALRRERVERLLATLTPVA